MLHETGGKDKILDHDVNVHVHNCISNMIRDGSAALRTQNRNHDSTTTRHFMVPFGRNKNFVGRNAILEQLLENIPPGDNQDDCQRTAVEGLGGAGKTQIALEAAYRVHDSYPDCSVYWVPAIDLTSFENAYREIGQLLQLPGIEHDKADVKLLVKAGLSQKSAGSWLLIVDNADDLELLSAILADYLPFSREGSILFTTRNHKTTAKLDIALEHILIVSKMNDAEATDLLQKGLRKEQMDNTENMQCLLNFLTNLPLAIKQASAFMASNTNVTVSEYLEICESSDAGLIDMLSEEFEDCHRYKDYAKKQNPVATTWWISFEYISRQDSRAADYLKFISLLAEKDIPQSFLPVASTSKIEMKKAMGTLHAYAFIIKRDTPDTFDIHRLVRLSMRNWLRWRGEWETWTTNVVQRLTEVYPFPEYENKETWMKYLPHGQAVLEIDGITGAKGDITLLFNIAASYAMLGKYSKSEQLYRKTLELKEKVLGKEHPDTLESMNNLANVLQYQGNYEEAKGMFRQVLELKEKVLGKEHPSTLSSINNFANVLQYQGNYEEAKEMFRQALELKEKVLGKEHPSTLSSINNFANVLQCQGNYEEAEEIYRQTLELIEKVLGKKHPSTLTTINNLAKCHTARTA
ncbi:hypothetical protein F5B21DRAFT_393516 [Xylaria acuta]|nr:hypothetical protein F5B21DRAFT_393516 [Xylaria acuta]